MGMFQSWVNPWFTPTVNENKDKLASVLAIAFLIFMLLYAVAVGGNISNFISVNQSTLIILFLTFISWAVIGQRPQIYASIGDNKNFYTAILVGVGTGVLLAFSMGFSILTPMSITNAFMLITIIYSALLIPLIEEKFFGQIVPFILGKSIKSEILIIILTCLGFGLFHFFSYKADLGTMFVAMIFRLIIMGGNAQFKSCGFGYGIHYTNNILSAIRIIVR